MGANQAVKRLLQELAQIEREGPENFYVYGLEENMFQWHFTIRGPVDSPFEKGFYHGKIVFTPGYPFEPPDVYFFTENGRFDTRMKICLSVTSYHPERWSASFTVSMLLDGIRDYMRESGVGSVGALCYPEIKQNQLAQESLLYECKVCQQNVKDHAILLNDRKTEKLEEKAADDKRDPDINLNETHGDLWGCSKAGKENLHPIDVDSMVTVSKEVISVGVHHAKLQGEMAIEVSKEVEHIIENCPRVSEKENTENSRTEVYMALSPSTNLQAEMRNSDNHEVGAASSDVGIARGIEDHLQDSQGVRCEPHIFKKNINCVSESFLCEDQASAIRSDQQDFILVQSKSKLHSKEDSKSLFPYDDILYRGFVDSLIACVRIVLIVLLLLKLVQHIYSH